MCVSSARVCMWRSEADLWKPVLSFHLGPREQTLRLFGFSLPSPYSVLLLLVFGTMVLTMQPRLAYS